MEDGEQLGILPATAQRPWMEPLSGMNGPLCQCGAQWSKPENPSELSHEVRTEDTAWRQADTAKVWGCATNTLLKNCMYWHPWKDKPEAKKIQQKQFVYLIEVPWCVVLGCSHLTVFRPFTDQTFTNNVIMELASSVWDQHWWIVSLRVWLIWIRNYTVVYLVMVMHFVTTWITSILLDYYES